MDPIADAMMGLDEVPSERMGFVEMVEKAVSEPGALFARADWDGECAVSVPDRCPRQTFDRIRMARDRDGNRYAVRFPWTPYIDDVLARDWMRV